LQGYGAAIIKNEANAMYAAPDITLEQAVSTLSKFTQSNEDRLAAEKAILKAQLPGIENSEVWGPEFIEYLLKNPSHIRRLERLYLLQNLELAKAKANKHWSDLSQGEIPFITDIRSDLALLTALNEMGVLDLVGMNLTNDSPEVMECYRKGKLVIFRSRLQRSPGKRDQAIAYLGRLLRMIGLESRCKRARRFKGDINPDRIYSYFLPSDPFDLAILECIDRRYAKLKVNVNNQTETTVQKEIEPDPPCSCNLNKGREDGSKIFDLQLPIVGQIISLGNAKYHVREVRSIRGIEYFILDYQGYRYLPILVSAKDWSDWFYQMNSFWVNS
jgi:hypothetical protein